MRPLPEHPLRADDLGRRLHGVPALREQAPVLLGAGPRPGTCDVRGGVTVGVPLPPPRTMTFSIPTL